MSLISPIENAATSQRAVPASRWAPLRWIGRVLLGLVVTAWSLLLIAWLTLHWGILPHIQQWREPIETRASQALGIPVRIGHIEVRSSGWVPAFELRDVTLLDPQNRPALRLPRISASVSPRSLLSFELRFEQLLIDGAQLEVRRDKTGRIFVAGLDFSSAKGSDPRDRNAADWFFEQHEFVIRGGALRWTDELRDAPPLALTDVQLLVRNGLRQHDIRFDATPPADWGDRFTAVGRFTQPLLAHRSDWQRWNGTAYVSLPRADVRELRRHLTLPFELNEGDGALRGWFEVKDGEPRAATVDIALRAVTLRLDEKVDALAFEQVQGRLEAQRNADGVTLAVKHFGFQTGDDVLWPQGDMSLSWRQREGQSVTGGQFGAQRLDLGLMAQIASRIPMGDALHQLLAELKPQGVIGDLSAQWDGPLDAPAHYRVKGSLSGLTLAAKPSPEPKGVGRPGLRNAKVVLDVTEAGGSAQVAIENGAVDLPGIFEEALLPLDRLATQVVWKIEPQPTTGKGNPPRAPQVTVQVQDARFANNDAQGVLSATWTTGKGEGVGRDGRYPGRLVLDSQLTNAVASRTARYLPLSITASTRHYVQHAVQSGTLASASFRVNGLLWDFPFPNARSNKDGEFRIDAKLDDVSFAYVPSTPASGAEPAYVSAWPALTHVDGELIIDRSTLEIRGAKTQLGGADWSSVKGAIKDLDNAVLTIDATGRGPLPDMLRFVNSTPVGPWMNKALATASGTGPADIQLGLTIPLADTDATKVKGSVGLVGNDVRITPGSPLLANAKGRVDFNDKGFAVVGATARVFGGDAAFDGGTQADASVRFTGGGTATVDGIKRAAELGDMTRAAAALSGQAAYRMSLGFVRGQPEVTVTSNLVGLGINLPAPLIKAPDAPLAMRYQNTLAPDSMAPGQTLRDTLRFELGSIVQALYQRDVSGDVPRVLRGGIGVMEAPPQPAAGVAASVNLPSLDVDAWQAAGDRLMGRNEGRGAAPGTGNTDAGGYAPDTLALRVREFVASGRRLDKLVAGVSQVGGLWRANLDADQLNGYVEYRPPRGGVGAGRVYARLSRLSLPKSDVDQVESLLDQQPANLPGLDVVVDDFELRGKRLGRVEIQAVNRLSSENRDALREWRLSTFAVTMPEARFTGSGTWAAVGGPAGGGVAGRRRSVLDFELAVDDSGALLERLGTPGAVRGGKGKLAGQVSWMGSPLTIDYESMAGQLNVAMEKGQFLKVNPGAARLLGVLSLQSLPRRLTLDFRDLFGEGFAFDSVGGDVTIAQGVAKTNNLRMRGVQAVVLMEGSADIAHESQDLRVVVVPEINAGTASLAYAVINPAIGLGTFLAQVVLRKQLIQAGTREFHVHGPWADPKVDSVDRKFSDDVPETEAPAASAPK